MAGIRKIVFQDLPPAEKERFYQFLVDHKVQFLQDPNGSGSFVATVRVTPPEGEASALKPTSQGPDTNDAFKKTAIGSKIGTGVPVDAHVVAPQLLVRRYKRFCAALLPPSAVPKLRRLGQLLQLLDEVYDARFVRDTKRVRNQQAETLGSAVEAPMSFPDFVVDFASKKYGLRKLVNQSCWDLAESVDQLRSEHLAVELFGRFLDEAYDLSDLLFFLFARSVVRREVTTHTPRGKQAVASGKVPFELDARQCVNITRVILGGEQLELQDILLRRLDAEMLRLRASGPEPVLDVNMFLGIATAEYHKMRGGTDVGPLPGGGAAAAAEASPRGSPQGPLSALGFGGTGPLEQSVQDYNEDVQDQIDKMARHLMVSLDGHGQAQGVDQRHIYEWAVQIVKRRLELRNDASSSGFGVEAMGGRFASSSGFGADAANVPTLFPRTSLPVHGDVGQSLMPPDLAELSAEEFERDMEAGMRRILQRSVEDLSGRVIASTVPQVDIISAGSYRAALAREIAPVADLLLEALVAQDQNLWIQQLLLDKLPAPTKELHLKRFIDLQRQLQNALAQDDGVHAVWKLTEQLVCTEVFVDRVNAAAAEILGSVAGLEVEPPIRATQFRSGQFPGAKSPLGQPPPSRRYSQGPADESAFDEDGVTDLTAPESRVGSHEDQDFGVSF